MRFGHVEPPVRDPRASKDVYVDQLGLELVDEQGERFVWVKAGDTELLLRPGEPVRAEASERAARVTLYTDDLPGHVATLRERGIELRQEGSCYYLQDPDGHWFQLVDPADHA